MRDGGLEQKSPLSSAGAGHRSRPDCMAVEKGRPGKSRFLAPLTVSTFSVNISRSLQLLSYLLLPNPGLITGVVTHGGSETALASIAVLNLFTCLTFRSEMLPGRQKLDLIRCAKNLAQDWMHDAIRGMATSELGYSSMGIKAHLWVTF